jgi:undecaprenyl-diphosphatase
MMTTIQGIVLGLVQGLTEFLPVSSSGHLVLFQKLFGLSEGTLSFDIAVHLATLVAVLVVFRREVWSMIAHPTSRLTLLVIVGTIPTVIIAFAFKETFESLFKSGKTLGLEFIFTGLVLLGAEGLAKRREKPKEIEETSYLDAAFVGTAQGLAILPAVSRSGLTLAGALACGMGREAALKLSFLMSIPPILGAGLLDAKDVIASSSGLGVPAASLAAGMIVAALSGYLAIRFMLKVFAKASLKYFAYYVLAIGLAVVAEQAFSGRIFGSLF